MKIARDKQKHILVGILMGVLFPIVGLWMWPRDIFLSVMISLAVVVVVGFGFEFYSLISGHGHAEWMDAIATLAGGLIGLGFWGIGYAMF